MSRIENRFPRYSRLLKLYPAAYRQQYGPETMQTLADMLDDPDNSKAAIWIRAAADLPLSLFKQNLIYVGGVMNNETPEYMKRNSLISALLISPFFIFVILNSLVNHSRAFSAGWSDFFLVLILGLPALALVLSLYTLTRWMKDRKSPARSLVDLRRNWPALTTGALALLIVLFIPFHDSTRCVTGNPVKEARNFDQTWHCIWRG